MNFECFAGLLMGKCGNRSVGHFASFSHRKSDAAINMITFSSEEREAAPHRDGADGFRSA